MDKSMYNLVIEPILTEKSNNLRESAKNSTKTQYTFKVRKDANKTEVMKAIKSIYDVTPVACNMVNVKPKKKNRRMSAQGYTRSWKKAVVTLDNNETIELFK